MIKQETFFPGHHVFYLQVWSAIPAEEGEGEKGEVGEEGDWRRGRLEKGEGRRGLGQCLQEEEMASN